MSAYFFRLQPIKNLYFMVEIMTYFNDVIFNNLKKSFLITLNFKLKTTNILQKWLMNTGSMFIYNVPLQLSSLGLNLSYCIKYKCSQNYNINPFAVKKTGKPVLHIEGPIYKQDG